MSARPVLHVLTGCTASGKTELALRWAETHGAEIVSCDSLLFYRGMDIGTAKPTRAELARVPHHLIDICGVRERMDVVRYVELARAAVKDVADRGRAILVTGGSGFYLKAFFAPVADAVAVSDEIRQQVREMDPAAALDELRRLNPDGLGDLDIANPRRVTRALERCLASGRGLRVLQEEFARQPAPFVDCAVRLVRIVRPPEEMRRRIELRVAAMLADGLVGEVRHLLGEGLRDNPSAASAIGYREVVSMLQGEGAEAELPAAIIRNTRALVKKQETWFRTQLPEHRVVAAAEATVATLFA